MDLSSVQSDSYGVPPEIYAVGVGWDPRPEVDRLLFLARQAGIEPQSVLELGCATGRLLAPLAEICPCVCGIDLHPPFIEDARRHVRADFLVGDMTDFQLGRRFDLIFTSANTIRHVLTDDAISRTWRRIAAHLNPNGIFIADLELARDHVRSCVGRTISWELAEKDRRVRVSWRVTAPPDERTRCCSVEYAFESLAEPTGAWRTAFELRTYDAEEFQRFAVEAGGMTPLGLFEDREPYLVETPPAKAQGRYLAVFQNRAAKP